MTNDAKTPNMLERLRKMEKLLEDLIQDQEELTRGPEAFPEFPRVRYDAGKNEFLIARDEFYSNNLIVSMDEITQVGELPVALADYAHRHPGEWITLAQVEGGRK